VPRFFVAGVVVPVKEMGALAIVSAVTSARWGVSGLGSAVDLDEPPKGGPRFVEKFGPDFFSTAPAVCLGALLAIALAGGVLALLFVRRAGRSRA
jgi:hypothetical protein